MFNYIRYIIDNDTDETSPRSKLCDRHLFTILFVLPFKIVASSLLIKNKKVSQVSPTKLTGQNCRKLYCDRKELKKKDWKDQSQNFHNMSMSCGTHSPFYKARLPMS